MLKPRNLNSAVISTVLSLAICLSVMPLNQVYAEPGGEAEKTPQAAETVTQTINSNTETSLVWIDVRSWIEYQADHIDGDPRIPHDDIVAGVSALYPDKDTPIRLYCAAGGRAGLASEQLHAAGYTDVVNVGGINDVRQLRKQSPASPSNSE